MTVSDGGNSRAGQDRRLAVARTDGGRYARGNAWERERGVPTADADQGETGLMRARRRGRQGRFGRWLRRIVATLVVVALLPLGLSLLYRIPAVHPVSTLMLVDAVTFAGYERRWTPLNEIGDHVVHAVMMSEDARFCAHDGVDWGALNSVINDALAGETTRGASTITMQTVKNLFLWGDRSYIRKAIEVPLALYFDFVVPKPRIMEIYLNIAQWGPHVYGAEAGAEYHFGKPARKLTPREAALLAVVLPDPVDRDPAHPSRGLRRLAEIIQHRARRAGGYIDCLQEGEAG